MENADGPYFQGTTAPPFLFELLYDKTISTQEVCLWLTVHAFQQRGRECWLSNDEMGERIGLQKRQVQNLIEHLEQLQLLSRVLVDVPYRNSFVKERYLSVRNPYQLPPTGGTPPCNTLHPPTQYTARPPRNTLHEREELRRDKIVPTADAVRDGQLGDMFGRMAQKLAIAISGVHQVNKNSNLKQWATALRLLNTKDGVAVPRIKAALRWYTKALPTHHHDKYFLVIESGVAFREKFIKLEAAMARDQNQNDQGQSTNTGGGSTVVAIRDETDYSPAELQQMLEEV